MSALRCADLRVLLWGACRPLFESYLGVVKVLLRADDGLLFRSPLFLLRLSPREQLLLARGCADLAIELEFHADDGRVTRRRWRPPAAADDASAADAPLIRLPYHPPLLAAIEQQLARGLPTRWWLRVDDAAQLVPAVALDAAALRAAEGSLRAAVQAQLLRVRAAAPTSWAVLVVLLEDWCLASALLRRAAAGPESLALSRFHDWLQIEASGQAPA